MTVKRCWLNGEKIGSIESACQQLARDLNFPDWAKPNLDALWDVLTTEIEGPIEIVWERYDVSKQAMGTDYIRLSRVLRAAAKERDDITFTRTKQKRTS